MQTTNRQQAARSVKTFRTNEGASASRFISRETFPRNSEPRLGRATKSYESRDRRDSHDFWDRFRFQQKGRLNKSRKLERENRDVRAENENLKKEVQRCRKLERENRDVRAENENLKKEVQRCRGHLREIRQELDVQRKVANSYKQRVKYQVTVIADKDKVIEQKLQDISQLCHEVEELEQDRKFLKDFIENLESELTCSICAEIILNPTTTSCGHSFCYDCLEEWEDRNPTCPTCRAPLDCQHKSIVLKSLIEEFVLQFYSESAKTARITLSEERKMKNACRRPNPTFRSRRFSNSIHEY
jgi:hypothetical protein